MMRVYPESQARMPKGYRFTPSETESVTDDWRVGRIVMPFLANDPLLRRRFMLVISVPAGRTLKIGVVPRNSVIEIEFMDGTRCLRRAEEFQFCEPEQYCQMLPLLKKEHEEWKRAKRERYSHKMRSLTAPPPKRSLTDSVVEAD